MPGKRLLVGHRLRHRLVGYGRYVTLDSVHGNVEKAELRRRDYLGEFGVGILKGIVKFADESPILLGEVAALVTHALAHR